MSAELAARDRAVVASAMLEARRRRAQGRRLAVAASSGFVLAVAAGSTLPFLAPVFAVQLLASSRRPLNLHQMLRLVLLVVVVGQTLALVSSLLGDRPAVFAPLLLAIYFLCFLARAKVGPAVDLVLLIAVIVPLLDVLHPDLGESIAQLLAKAMAGGVLLAWMAHAILPDPGDGVADTGPPRTRAPRPIHRAFASASILLGAVLACFVDSRLSSAVVIPMTAATLLGQLDLAATGRSALGLVFVNLMGGAAALLVFTVVEIEPTLLCLFLATMTACLLFSERAAASAPTGGAFVGALIIFLILLGLGVSPLPTTTPESFSTRIWFVLFATLYTLCFAAAFWPQPRKALWASATVLPLSMKPKLDEIEASSRCVG